MRIILRNRSLLVSRLVQPVLWVAVLGVTFNNMLRGVIPIPGNVDYLSFMTAGIIAMTIIFTSLFGGMSLVWDREIGTLKEFLAAPIPRMAIPVGNALSVTGEGLLQSAFILLIAVPLGVSFAATPISIIGFIVVVVLISMTLYGLAASIASRLKNTQSFMGVVTFLTMPLFFVSGSMYPVQFLPYGLQELAKVSPVTHAIALTRYFLMGAESADFQSIWGSVALPTPFLNAILSVSYLGALSLLSMSIASLLFRRATSV